MAEKKRANGSALYTQNTNEFADGSGGFIECGLFVTSEFDFDDLLDPARAELGWHADEKVLDAVFAFQIGGAGQDFFLVEEDGAHHFDHGGGGSVVGRAGFEEIDNFGTAFSGAGDDGFDFFSGEQVGKRDAGDGGVARQRDHVVTVTAEDEGVDVFDGDTDFLSDEGAHARRVEDAGHADDAIFREAGVFVGDLGHGIERIGDQDKNGVRREFADGGDDAFDDVGICFEEIVAGHAGFAREAGGDDDDVAILGGGIITGGGGDAEGVGVAGGDGRGFEHVESFTGGRAVENIGEDDIGEAGVDDALGGGGTDEAATDYGNFSTGHLFLLENCLKIESRSEGLLTHAQNRRLGHPQKLLNQHQKHELHVGHDGLGEFGSFDLCGAGH